ncbi:phospholipase A2, partial [Arthrobacter sp. HMSC06H05]
AEALATGVISDNSELIIKEASASIKKTNKEMSGSVSFSFDNTKASERLRSSVGPDPRTTSAHLVTVPSHYRYCPHWCKPKSLHDYCTWSPDQWFKADFRGPCAIHDLGIEETRKKPMNLEQKRNERRMHDYRFGANLRTNCAYFYPAGTLGRSHCNGATHIYQSAVLTATANWDGS